LSASSSDQTTRKAPADRAVQPGRQVPLDVFVFTDSWRELRGSRNDALRHILLSAENAEKGTNVVRGDTMAREYAFT
jgi:hypothetical protein